MPKLKCRNTVCSSIYFVCLCVCRKEQRSLCPDSVSLHYVFAAWKPNKVLVPESLTYEGCVCPTNNPTGARGWSQNLFPPFCASRRRQQMYQEIHAVTSSAPVGALAHCGWARWHIPSIAIRTHKTSPCPFSFPPMLILFENTPLTL